ncbi:MULTISPECIES: hypothetical protein [Anaerococcus]|uniref:Uncharacterized protein n=1 Tax=Anaerococcus octavius TaxID=54007 RepID=A0A380WVY3_9FIRM|nr:MULTISPECIES: hypothetical protein [Anaerococcus]MBP2069002.1 hypothetical protein [Anaerococcus nagyae]MDU1828564.1 hypothetical protein [Anaerococcus sp.]MDU1865147.1 hypothetical protein [Anaerococcus sp.]MDU2566470.1 hypothetical protein [Anaerococcus sp.]MDU4025056.1 hypothetical protein [Anaerococcus sp.]
MENKTYKNVLNTLFGLLIIGIGIYFLVKLIIKFFYWIRSFASNTEAVIVVALITGTLSLLGIVISNIIEYKQNTKRYLYEKKEEAYSEFIEMVYKLQQIQKDGKISEKEITKDLISFSQKLTLWGSDEVVRKWIEIRTSSLNSDSNSINNLFVLEDIIFLIRKDLGQKNKGLKRGDILSFFINDIDNYLPNSN